MDKETIKILLVEDDLSFKKLLEIFLSKGNLYKSKFMVYNVKRLSEAIEKIKEDNFDILLLDLHLPDSSGIETFNAINEFAI
ncbi:MAG: response regulator, partial [Spirochaetota bacterium]